MRHLLLGLALIASAEGAALACSCLAPGTREQSRAMAREAVAEASAIVEVEVLSEYDARSRRGEQVRVLRTLFGRAPATFGIERNHPPSSASCDLGLTRGERRVLILYPANARGARPCGSARIHGLCSDTLVNGPDFLAMTLEEARRRR